MGADVLVTQGARASATMIWVRSRNCGCLVSWFCYQLIAKPGNDSHSSVPWPIFTVLNRINSVPAHKGLIRVCPHGWAMGCLWWGFSGKKWLSQWHHTVFITDSYNFTSSFNSSHVCRSCVVIIIISSPLISYDQQTKTVLVLVLMINLAW